jgi:putative aldouronate transport system permease protein
MKSTLKEPIERYRLAVGKPAPRNGFDSRGTRLDRMRLAARTVWKQRPFFLLLIPGIVYFVVFQYLPLAGSVVGFKDFSVKAGIWESPWADPWYKHVLFFVRSPYFVPVVRNTLVISTAKIFLGLPFSVALAIFLFECHSMLLRRSVQTVTYMPHFLSWVIVYGISLSMFSETTGLFNALWHKVFGGKISFFTEPGIFRGLIIGSDIWKNTGWSAIIFLAAISGIDPTLYQAAAIDGARRWQCTWFITLPSIRNLIVLLLILKCGHILNAGFDQIYIMYNPMVYPAADIIDTWVFRTGLEKYNFSLATAVGLFKSIIGMFLVLSVNRIARMWGESMW